MVGLYSYYHSNTPFTRESIQCTQSTHEVHVFIIYKVRQKVAPKVFCRFSATAWNFNMEFYRFIFTGSTSNC